MGLDINDYLEKELQLLLGWIAAAETKIPNILLLATSMLGALAALSGVAKSWSGWAISVSIAAVCLLALCILFSALSSFPRTSGPKSSMVFFGPIAQKSLAEFKASVVQLTSEAYQDDLAAQCHRNAEIAEIKHKYVRWSLSMLFLAAPTWAWAIYLLFSPASGVVP